MVRVRGREWGSVCALGTLMLLTAAGCDPGDGALGTTVDGATAADGGAADAQRADSQQLPDGPEALAGQWSGFTAQGYGIKFTVSPAGMTRMELAWRFERCSFATTVDFPDAAPIRDGAFQQKVILNDGDVAAQVAITFDSARVARGSITYDVAVAEETASCSGLGLSTFSATRQ